MATTDEFWATHGAATTVERDILASDVDGRLVVPADVVRASSGAAPGDGPGGAAGDDASGGASGGAGDDAGVGAGDGAGEAPVRRRGTLPEWLPVALAFAGWPLWWLLGVTQLVFILAAIPLAWTLKKRGNVRYPPGFGIWVVFLVLVLFSAFALNVEAQGTVASEGSGRYVAFAFRFANYLALTVFLLYIGNATERVLPRAKVINWLAWLGLSAIGLGLLALLMPHLEFTSPLSRVLPSFLSDGTATQLAQVQPVLGAEPTPRPAAPFKFTNAWGNNTSLLMVWMVLAWWVLGSKRRRVLLAVVLVLASMPIVYSLNRGMWLGLGLAVAIVVIRLALRGRALLLVSTSALLIVASAVFVLSPLETLVIERLHAGHSNSVRTSLAETSLATALQSPIIGFGSTRDTLGSDASIAVGPTEECPRCGGRDIGSTGQFTLLLIAQGLMGLLLYVAFFVRSIFAFARDHSPLGLAGTTVLAMELFYGFFYSALLMPLAIAFCAMALLWRNEQIRSLARQQAIRPAPEPDALFRQRT